MPADTHRSNMTLSGPRAFLAKSAGLQQLLVG